jgi:hypothetical protein
MSSVPYGVTGYRSDCRYSPFNGIMTIDHSLGQAGSNVAWFLLDRLSIASTAFTAASSTGGTYNFDTPATFSGYGQWKGFGVVSLTPYTFQVGICDSNSTSKATGLGIFISGSYLLCLMSVYIILCFLGYSGLKLQPICYFFSKKSCFDFLCIF